MGDALELPRPLPGWVGVQLHLQSLASPKHLAGTARGVLSLAGGGWQRERPHTLCYGVPVMTPAPHVPSHPFRAALSIPIPPTGPAQPREHRGSPPLSLLNTSPSAGAELPGGCGASSCPCATGASWGWGLRAGDRAGTAQRHQQGSSVLQLTATSPSPSHLLPLPGGLGTSPGFPRARQELSPASRSCGCFEGAEAPLERGWRGHAAL